MRLSLFLSTFFFLLLATNPAVAFPHAVANFILGRPITESSVKKQMAGMEAFTDPFIKGTDAISISKFRVGDPEIELSVLVVEPRLYGVMLREKIELKKDMTFNYSLSVNMDDGEASQAGTALAKKLAVDAGEDENNFTATPKRVSQILQEQARVGGTLPSTDQPRTIFLILGYGVPKEVGLPMALLLANHGIRTVIPDLRGQGDSGGKGVTWGKDEPGDLDDLLTVLQTKGIVDEDKVGVIGVSYGAAMASLWAAQDVRIEATVLAAPFQRADTKIVKSTQYFLGDLKLPFKLGEETLVKGAEIAAQRLDTTWENLSPLRAVQQISKPVLFLASSGDEIISQREVQELYELAPKGSKLHVYEDLPHTLLGLNFAGIESVVVDWLTETGFLLP